MKLTSDFVPAMKLIGGRIYKLYTTISNDVNNGEALAKESADKLREQHYSVRVVPRSFPNGTVYGVYVACK